MIKRFGIMLMLFVSCNGKNANQGIVRTYFPDTDNVRSVVLEINGKKERQEIIYYPNGNIRTITTYKNGLKQGWQYWFFESGTLDADRLWVNDKKNGYCNDYYDTTGNTKASLYYENDKLIYRKNFDKNGEVGKIEK